MDSIELLRVIQSFSEFIIAGQSSLYRVGGHEARRGIIGRLRFKTFFSKFLYTDQYIFGVAIYLIPLSEKTGGSAASWLIHEATLPVFTL